MSATGKHRLKVIGKGRMGVNCDSEMDGQENFITQVIFQYMNGEEGSYEKIWEKYISGKGNAKARRLGMSKQ